MTGSLGGAESSDPFGRPGPLWSRMIAPALAVFAAIAMGLLFCTGFRPPEQAGPGARNPEPATQLVDVPAPRLVGRTLSGAPFDLAALRGQPVLVNVWASWCDMCGEELRLIGEAARRWAGEGLHVVGVNIRDDDERARASLAAAGAGSVTTVVDHAGAAAVDWGVRGVPETYLIDRRGRLRVVARGAITEDWLSRWVEPRLGAS